MRKKPLLWIIVTFFFVFLFSLVINIPASQVFRLIKLPPGLQIQGISGTVSNGEIDRLYYQGFNLSSLRFEHDALCLLKLSICYQLTEKERDLTINLASSLLSQHVSIENSRVNLDGSIFNNYPNMLIKPKGEFVVNVDDVTFSGVKLSNLQADIEWLNAGVEGEDQILGTYNAHIVQEKEQIKIKLSDQESLLTVFGDVDIKWNGSSQIDLILESRPSLNPSIKSVLEISTKKVGLNKFEIKKSYSLPLKIKNILKEIH